MHKEIIAPLRAVQAAVAELSRDIAQLRLEARQTRLRKETTNSRELLGNVVSEDAG